MPAYTRYATAAAMTAALMTKRRWLSIAGWARFETLDGLPVACKVADCRSHVHGSRYARGQPSDSRLAGRGASSLVDRLLVEAFLTRPHGDASPGGPDEAQQLVDVGRSHRRLDARDRLAQVEPGAKQDAERRQQRADAGGVESAAPQPHPVEPAHRVRAVHDAEGRNVPAGAREATQDREPSDTDV